MRKLIAIAVLVSFLFATTVFAFRIQLVEGWTGDLDFQLRADGTTVDLTGMTVELLLYKVDGTTVNTSGDITVFDAATGTVRYAPDATDLLAADSPFRSRFKVTDGVGKIVYFPNAGMDRWVVRNP